MKVAKLLAGTAVLLLAAGVAQAKPKGDEPVFEPGKPLIEQVQRIEKQLNDGETYSEIEPAQRSEVRAALSRLRSIAEQYPAGASVPETVKVDQFNEQDRVNVILTKAREDSRQVCTREKTVGSNFATTRCMTVAQRQRAKDSGQKLMQDAQRTGQFRN